MALENAYWETEFPHKIRSRFHVPPNEFAGCFTTFYHLELEVYEGVKITDYLQPEWGTIRFFAGGDPVGRIGDSALSGARCAATGPSSLPLKFSLSSVRMWGIGFLPLGWARLVRSEAAPLADRVFNAETHDAFRHLATGSDIMCDPEASVDDQYGAIVEVMRAGMRPSREDDTIRQVHRVLLDEDLASVKDFAERASMSVRTLERITKRYFGFAPKLLMRRQRFMRSLTHYMLNRNAKWTEAMDGLYHDQAQFSREFRQFMRMSPSEYAALDHPILDSFVEARARLWGSPAQTLDRPN